MFFGHGTSVSFTISLFVLAGSLFASTPAIRSLSVEGNVTFTSREILGWLSSREGLPFNQNILHNDLQSIREKYRQQGYYSAMAGSDATFSADSTGAEITIRITEGKQSVVGELRIEGLNAMTAPEVLASFDTKSGRPLDTGILERDIDAFLQRYEQAGYPFTICSVANVSHRTGEENDFVDILLDVTEGSRLTIDEIRVEGNKETDASVVVRETRVALDHATRGPRN